MECKLLLLFFLLFFRSTIQQQHQSLPLNSTSERAALLQLRASLGLRAKEWPIKPDPCLNWIGILCEDGHVVGINISGFKRTPIGNRNPKFSVDALANFTKLISFNASRFPLPGSIPNCLGIHLPTLKFLDLRSCEISGAIPSTIGNLSNLSELYLSSNTLNGTIPSTLSLLSQLSVLDLSRNSLTGSIPTQLSNLTSLIVLDLSSNSLSGNLPSEFGNLKNLQRMTIHNNNFTGDLPCSLCSLPGLTFLDASDNNFVGPLPNLSLNPNATMAVFNLSHNMFYGVLTSILTRVNYIDLCYNYLQGRISYYARNVSSLDKNCFRNWSSQRNVKECVDFYTMTGLPFHNFGLPNGTLPHPTNDHKTNRKKLITAIILSCVGLILPFVIFVIPFFLCCKKRKTSERGNGSEGVSVNSCGLNLNLSGLGEVMDYEKILVATSEFNDANLIKNGQCGDIFKGILDNGVNIIVKRFDMRSSKKSCMVELDFFSKVSHSRIVPLLGHCLEKEKEKFLVYKYMPKGDLSSSLHMTNGVDNDSLKSLDWITRLKIAIGTAEILYFLHHECVPPLVHRDVQASSILLDDKYEVRLGSLSKACIQKDNNTHSNRITRLLTKTCEQGVRATCAYDVYCFGKVLMELVSGKIGISASSDSTTKNLLKNMLPYISIYDKELVTNIMDPTLIVDEDLLKEVWVMAVIAKSCLNPKPSRRPVMRFVLKALENPLKIVVEKQTRSGRVRVGSARRSGNASWRSGSGDVAGGEGRGSGSRSRGRCLSVRKESKDVVPEPLDVEDEEIVNEDWDGMRFFSFFDSGNL